MIGRTHHALEDMIAVEQIVVGINHRAEDHRCKEIDKDFIVVDHRFLEVGDLLPVHLVTPGVTAESGGTIMDPHLCMNKT